MKLLIQPGAGIASILKGIQKAKKSVEIAIFRFDRKEIERALAEAVERGVFVHALIAFTNRGGEDYLRELEMRFLDRGITVARTADDLVRFHGKMMIIDRKDLYLLGFNWTHLDIERSRSFGVITRNRALVKEAVRLFEADTKRQPYKSDSEDLVVSPVNSREVLGAFIAGAKRELLIYDLKVSDRQMLRLLQQKQAEGVKVRVLGQVAKRSKGLEVRPFERMRLHTRTILRDGSHAFVGSQSLRQLELDARREIGMITRDRSMISEMTRVFEEDWKVAEAEFPTGAVAVELPAKAKKRIVKAVEPALDKVVGKLARTDLKSADADAVHDEAKAIVKKAVKEVVQESIADLLTQQEGNGAPS